MKTEAPSKLEDSLSEILVWLKEAAQGGADFAAEQAPLVCQEIVAYGRVYHTAWIAIIFVLWSTVVMFLWLNIRKVTRDDSWDDSELTPQGVRGLVGSIVFAIATFVLSIEGGTGIFSHGKDAMLAWFAPRLYIVEYISDLL